MAGLALAALGCSNPVNINLFLENEIVQELIEGGGIKIIVTLNPPGEGEPVLTRNGTTIAKGSVVNLPLGESVTITVSNPGTFNITWAYNTNNSFSSGASCTIDTSDPRFDKPGNYVVTLEATDGPTWHSSYIIIKVHQ